MNKPAIACCELLLILGSYSVAANDWYVGGGLSYLSVDSGHPSIPAQGTMGYQLVGGRRWNRWGLELELGGGSLDAAEIDSPYYPADSIDYGIIDFSVKYFLLAIDENTILPWVGVGYGLHMFTWNSYYYDISGDGLSLSAGVDYRLFSSCFFQSGIKYYSYRSTDMYGEGSYSGNTVEIDIGVVWVFNGTSCLGW